MKLLDDIKTTYARLDHLQQRKTVLEARLSASPATDAPKVKTSPTDRHSLYLAMISDLSVEIDSLKLDLEALWSDLAELMLKADLGPDETEVMRLRYVYGLPWDDIALCMYWSTRHCQQLHGTALQKLRACA